MQNVSFIFYCIFYQRFYCTKSKESTDLHHSLVGVISLTDRHSTDKMSPPLLSLSPMNLMAMLAPREKPTSTHWEDG